MIRLPEKIPQKGFYYHYKHDPKGPVENYAYEVLGVGFHTEEDGVSFVIYRPLYKTASVYEAGQKMGIQGMDARPTAMWMGEVEKEGKTFPRFSKINDEKIIAELEAVKKEIYP